MVGASAGRRSAGRYPGGALPARRDPHVTVARAFWTVAPGQGELRPEVLPDPGGGRVLARTLASGVSRGTEAVVFAGRVPPSQYAAMRAPLMAGTFPFPVKYGYSAVGCTPEGRRMFVLHPHQDAFVVPAAMCIPVPERCRPAVPCWRQTWKPRSTCCGTRHPSPASACWWSAPAWSAAGRLAARPHPGRPRHRGRMSGRNGNPGARFRLRFRAPGHRARGAGADRARLGQRGRPAAGIVARRL